MKIIFVLLFRLSSAPNQHPRKVKKVQQQVLDWIKSGSTKPMCTARPGWQTISLQNMVYKKRMSQIKIELVDILEVNTEQRYVRCEPLVSMGQLSHTLSQLGWTIPILPELDDLTVGGLVMGTGIETSSHKYGLFQHICQEYELVMADGSVIVCSEEENQDLFYAVPWSYGTLGFLVSVKIKIVPSKQFVHINYFPMHSMQQAIELLRSSLSSENPDEFIECLVFSKDTAVVMTANFSDKCDSKKLNRIGRWFKPWFFKHVECMLKKSRDGVSGVVCEEWIPLRDYYHRHSRSIFWEIQDIIPFGNNILFRYVFGWLIPPKISLLKLTQGKTIKRLYEQHHMVQDMLVPLESLQRSLDMFEEQVSIYPLWICPFKLPNNLGMLRTDDKIPDMFVDIGVYGVPKRDSFDAVQTTRTVEEFVRREKGFQMLYADSYLTREEFSTMFDLDLYSEMREKYRCQNAFPHVYDKINKHARSTLNLDPKLKKIE